MTDKPATTPAAKPTSKSEEPPAQVQDEAPKYHVDRLTDESEAFLGQPSHVVAGALHGEQKKNFTLDEAKEAIEAWLDNPVTTEEQA